MNKILIATDFSAAAENAVEYGADLSKHFSAEIVLVHSFRLPLEGYDLTNPLRVISELQENALERLNVVKMRIISRLGYDPGITCVSESGRALDVIRIAADTYGVDLIVAGMVGEAGPIKRHVIGSTALALASHLAVPVVIVPEQAHYRKIRKISFAWDMPLNEDDHVIHTARAISAEFGAKLEIVEAVDDEVEDVTAFTLERRDEFKRSRVAGGRNPGETLEAHFKNHATDLVMLCPRKHNLLHRLFQEGTIARLAFKLQTPLLIIRA